MIKVHLVNSKAAIRPFRSAIDQIRSRWFVVIFFLTLIGAFSFSLRFRLPFQLIQEAGYVFVTADKADASRPEQARRLVAIDGMAIFSIDDIDAYLSRKKPGDLVAFSLEDGSETTITLNGWNDPIPLVVNVVTGLCFIIIGSLIWQRKREGYEYYFARACVYAGFIIAVAGAPYQLHWLLALPMTGLYFYYYSLSFTSFYLFSASYPITLRSRPGFQVKKVILSLLAVVLTFVLTLISLIKLYHPSSEIFILYLSVYRIFRLVILLLLIMTFSNFIRIIRQGKHDQVIRQRVMWVLGGTFLGTFPFIFLWNLPQIFGFQPIIQEFPANLFLILTPLSIAVAIVRHKLFEFDIVLSRSLVYSGLFSISILVYMGVISLVSLVFYHYGSSHSPFLFIIASIAIGLSVTPLKNKLQVLVDRKIFHIRYDRFSSLQHFMQKIEDHLRDDEVLMRLVREYQQVVPVEHILLVSKSAEELTILHPSEYSLSRDLQLWCQSSERLDHIDIAVSYDLKSAYLESDISVTPIVIPEPWILVLHFYPNYFIFLGPKKAGNRFWREDIELLRQMKRAADLHLSKLGYMQMFMREKFDKEQALRASDWKSLLLMEVAHDLRSPLNTLLWKIKRLEQKVGDELPRTHVLGMHNQLNHMVSLIESMLLLAGHKDFGSHVEKKKLRADYLIDNVLLMLHPTITRKKLQIQTDFPRPCLIPANEILLRVSLENIMNNAVKFSPPGGTVTIAISEENSLVRILVMDEGPGMTVDQIERIFSPFSDSIQGSDGEKGFHLGLYLSREFSTLLGGRLEIRPGSGVGTQIVIELPLTVESTAPLSERDYS